MESMHYVGLDIHKKIITYCIKTFDGQIIGQATIPATRKALNDWMAKLPKPWTAAMEATIFTGWIYDYLKPHAFKVIVAHPEMLKAITAAKKKNDKADAEKIADLLRVNMLPESYMAPQKIRELRRTLRYRNHIVRIAVREKNKISGLLMEVGIPYAKRRLHGKKYFKELLENMEDPPESVIEMLRLSRSNMDIFNGIQKKIVRELRQNPLIQHRINRLMTIPGVGEITALTWVLETGEPERFRSIKQAVSYCGLCSAQHQSAGMEHRGPISKKRNKHLQTVLIEAAKIGPIWNPQLADVYQRESAKGNKNRATLAVARKLVAFMLSVDKSGKDFRPMKIQKAA